MSSTFTTTFTRTHAKHLAAKLMADMYQCRVFYDRPSEEHIRDCEIELIEKLSSGYVATYEFGFKKDDRRVLTWAYTVGSDGGLYADSNAGAIYAKAAVADASYYNFMEHSSNWMNLTPAQRTAFENALPFQRTTGSLPTDGDGVWIVDHGYTAGGVRIDRRTFRPR